MTGFNAVVYPWQQGLWQHLIGYVRQQRMPQALLFHGASGLGKRHLLDAFAQNLLCHALLPDLTACGVCSGCKLLSAGTHPDYLQIEPDEAGKGIGIDKIRQLIVKLALKPHFSVYRTVIIQPADRLNKASANAFLKCLEEPTERTCFFLVTDQLAQLPATIRSRCQILFCPIPGRNESLQWLQQQGISENADNLLMLAQGAPLRAWQDAKNDHLVRRDNCFVQWLQIVEGKTNGVDVAEQWQRLAPYELTVLLNWIVGWVVDIIKLSYQVDVHLLQNQDKKKSLQALAERLELPQLYAFYDALLQARSQLDTQINKQLMLEQLLIHWSQLKTG